MHIRKATRHVPAVGHEGEHENETLPMRFIGDVRMRKPTTMLRLCVNNRLSPAVMDFQCLAAGDNVSPGGTRAEHYAKIYGFHLETRLILRRNQ